MTNRTWIILGIGAVAATYVVLNRSSPASPTGFDDVESLADTTASWGSKQRIKGSGKGLLGKMKEGFGRTTGDYDLADEGVMDQVTGAAKDTAGRAAHVVSDAIRDLNR